LKKLLKLQGLSGLKMLLTVKVLLSFLVENKERLEELKYKHGATSNPENVQLWKDAKS